MLGFRPVGRSAAAAVDSHLEAVDGFLEGWVVEEWVVDVVVEVPGVGMG